jgi:hypothetical protein
MGWLGIYLAVRDTTLGASSCSLILIVHLSGTILLRPLTKILAEQKYFLLSYSYSTEDYEFS